ncbi:MAG: lysylphosphatidylglycerol synthase transmembrane domain-containing protein [bacterium]
MNTGGQTRWAASPWLKFALSVTIAVTIFTLLFSNVTWEEVKGMILGMNRQALLVFFGLSLTMNILRTVRYRLVLKVAGHVPGAVPLFLVVLVRGLFVDLLPARLGELVYIYLLKTRLKVPLGTATASFALAFLFDIVALAPLVFVAALFVEPLAEVPVAWLVGGGVVLLAASGGVIFAMPCLLRTAYWVLSGKYAVGIRAGRALADFVAATDFQIRKARRAGIFWHLLGISLLVRVSKYSALYVLFFAMTSPMGYTLADLPVPKLFFGLCSAELAASLPISGIAGFGVYEGTWAMVFTLLGFPQKIAILTSISHHLFTQLYGYALGTGALVLLFLPSIHRRLRRAVSS